MENSVLKNIKIFHQLVINSIGVKDMPKYPSVTTTQIYARHADPKRREAANRMSFEVLNDVSESKNESSETGTSDE